MTVQDVITRFEAEYLEPNSISAARRQQQKRLIERLDEFIGERPITELTMADVNTFIGVELARGIHPNTGRKYVGMVHSFASWGRDVGVLAFPDQLSAVRKPRGSTAQSDPKPYSSTEIKGLYEWLGETWPHLPVSGRGSQMLDRYLAGRKRKDKTQPLFGHVLRHALRLQMEAQVALALEQGLRRSEILDLTIAAMHPDNSQLAVRNAKQLPGQNVKRMLPYSLHARKVVGEWLEFRWLLNPDHDSPFLALTNGQATQLEPQSLPQISAVIERAESTWRWHRLRHTAITMWLRAGVPLEKLQIFAGHTDIAQTLRYAKISEADVDEAFQAVEEKFNRRLGIAA